jgi:hypothetical protein
MIICNARDLLRRARQYSQVVQLLLDGIEPGLPPRNSARFRATARGTSLPRQRHSAEPGRPIAAPSSRPTAAIDKMEPIAIPGSMASPLSSNRRRHVAGAMTNTHALRGTSPMSGPDIQAAYKEYERSFDELSQASAASPPLFKRRWGDGSVDDDDVSVLTAPVIHQQRRPSQRELERELVRADNAGRVTDHNSTATAITRRAPDERSVVSEASTASAFEVQRQGHLGVVEKFHAIPVAPVHDKKSGGAPARCEQAPARAQPRATRSSRSSAGSVSAVSAPAPASLDAAGADDQVSVVTAAASAALELEIASPSRVSLATSPSKSLATASPSKMSHIFSDTATTATATASPSKSHIFGDALSVSTTTTHVQPARAPGAGRAVTCADLAAFTGDATHLERAVEERSVAFSPPRSRQMVVERRRALGRCLTPEDALLPRTLRRAIKRTSPPKARKSALPSPVASPPARRPAPTGAYVRPVPTRDGVRSLLKTFPRHWTDIEEHTNWGRPEKVRKDVVLRVDEKPGVDPTTYRTHHLRRPDALKPFDHLLDPGRNLASK